MKKLYVKPEMDIHYPNLQLCLETFSGDDWLGNRRKNAIVEDDEPAAAGDEGGYKRTLW
ncbi:MAG: hypothetical protein J6M19_02040 [Bacteroidaceae bacterium]|nr:hypothetical protein [Bacteroidaceae bacterium]